MYPPDSRVSQINGELWSWGNYSGKIPDRNRPVKLIGTTEGISEKTEVK